MFFSQLYLEARALREGSMIPPRRRRTRWRVDSYIVGKRVSSVDRSIHSRPIPSVKIQENLPLIVTEAITIICAIIVDAKIPATAPPNAYPQSNSFREFKIGVNSCLIPSGCCSRSEYGHPRAACQRRSGAAGQGEYPPCPGSWS
ncbi:hypothetical protein ASPVEDRAFT_773918 [Aspergillus versicolor CBS 583.65]|uniref:Uncharacterized protein n=1 Tax=Aspergillus versicolor CBS 583.65 TaxID=1036611 RepID=A0A1L9PRJ6_ASPVE|nr:uncharacterized protein ASPVEDRAFT_773918 [Aspergillus versicolor CBS 583.65]OJJ04150.1 hypothetical protein ASPVEDRAFT_773918 [Aspergillus versicolor CBS 583.65]